MSIANQYRLFTTVSADKRSVEDILTISGASTVYSNPWRAKLRDSFSFNVQWTGTVTVGAATGLTLWCTGHSDPNLANDDDWTQITYVPGTFPNGSAGKLFDTVGNCPVYLVRLKLVFTGGAGTLRGYAPVI